jgi:hypothetical protein
MDGISSDNSGAPHHKKKCRSSLARPGTLKTFCQKIAVAVPRKIKVWSRSFQEARDTYQDHRSHKGNHDRTDSAAGSDAHLPKQPAAQNASQDSQHDIGKHPVPAAFHHLASQPTGN